MSQKFRKISLRYARALYGAIAAETSGGDINGIAQQVAGELGELGAAWEAQPEFSRFVLNPMFSKEDRKRALIEVARLGKASPVLERFLAVVFDRDRVAALPEIAEAFKKTADEASGVVQVEVVTASAIEAGERTEIEQKLAKKIQGKPSFSWAVDPGIIGGVIVKFSGKVLDGSLQGKLSSIERELSV